MYHSIITLYLGYSIAYIPDSYICINYSSKISNISIETSLSCGYCLNYLLICNYAFSFRKISYKYYLIEQGKCIKTNLIIHAYIYHYMFTKQVFLHFFIKINLSQSLNGKNFYFLTHQTYFSNKKDLNYQDCYKDQY